MHFPSTDDWLLTYSSFEPEHEPVREVLCALGNGYLAIRGAFEESAADAVHYPGTYLAGAYNRLTSHVAGREIENEDLVNWPNGLSLTFRPEGGDWLDLHSMEVRDFSQTLDIRQAILTRNLVVRDHGGRETALTSQRCVHLMLPHHVLLRWSLTPLNWCGTVEVQSQIDGSVVNWGVPRYRALNHHHLIVSSHGRFAEDGIFLVSKARQSGLRVAMASRLCFSENSAPVVADRTISSSDKWIRQTAILTATQQRPLSVHKSLVVATSRDLAVSEPLYEACKLIQDPINDESLRQQHTTAWRQLWERCDLRIQDEFTQRALRLHIFHLLQTVSPNTMDLDVGVPARGWHGEAYRGHIFWDELFIFPFLTLRLPELTRALLMYRYRRLPEARRQAKKGGYRGAMYPWQSGSDGREESQTWHLNPQSGEWKPDHSRLQVHVNAAIAYNVWQFYQATGDLEFLERYGAELILEVARFWASIARFNSSRDRFDIHGIMGPDEYHDAYPDAARPGINNNTYTNVMASWTLRKALVTLETISPRRRSELRELLEIDDDELARFGLVSRRLYLPIDDQGMIEQFEGFFRLEEFPWQAYRQRYGDIHRLDRILAAEGDSCNRYQVTKQADVLMLFYLFSNAELKDLFSWLGYELKATQISTNIDFYEARTAHGSTLSYVVSAWTQARQHRPASFQALQEALKVDLEDRQGGTTQEGIHLGAMAGTVDIVQRCYTGLEITGDMLRLAPRLPPEVGHLSFSLYYRGHWLTLEITPARVTIEGRQGGCTTIKVAVRSQVERFRPGERKCLVFSLDGTPPY